MIKDNPVGDYFWDSLLADIESLVLYAVESMASTERLPSDSPMPSTMTLWMTSRTL